MCRSQPKGDGEGYSLVFFYRLTAEAREAARTNSTAAAQLLKQFVAHTDELAYHGRFKAIPRLVNPDTVNLGSALRQLTKTYNAKPFLTGPAAHRFCHGPGYCEADIDIHLFCYVARKAAYNFLDIVKSMIVDISFVVEGISDAELPEQILGGARISLMDPSAGFTLQHWIDKAKKEEAEKAK